MGGIKRSPVGSRVVGFAMQTVHARVAKHLHSGFAELLPVPPAPTAPSLLPSNPLSMLSPVDVGMSPPADAKYSPGLLLRAPMKPVVDRHPFAQSGKPVLRH